MLRHFISLYIDNDLLTAMAERWRPELHTFHFPKGKMTITLRDVAILTGLPVTGEAIIDNSSKPEVGWGSLILDRLGFNMPTTTLVEGVGHPPLNAGQVSIPWLFEHIQLEVNFDPDTLKIRWSDMHASTSLAWLVDFCSPTRQTGGYKACGCRCSSVTGTRSGERVWGRPYWLGSTESCALAQGCERNKLVVRCSYSNSGHGSIFQCSHLQTRRNSSCQMRSYEL
ncbi:unnamed protein product [Linum trigynum]|uniref:Aminotransferase-like plant mobile domain-containing protein n=1 Tax=Linum trigynum TaxID=586398 RepID=A0AAV2DBR2_9ROSI